MYIVIKYLCDIKIASFIFYFFEIWLFCDIYVNLFGIKDVMCGSGKVATATDVCIVRSVDGV